MSQSSSCGATTAPRETNSQALEDWHPAAPAGHHASVTGTPLCLHTPRARPGYRRPRGHWETTAACHVPRTVRRAGSQNTVVPSSKPPMAAHKDTEPCQKRRSFLAVSGPPPLLVAPLTPTLSRSATGIPNQVEKPFAFYRDNPLSFPVSWPRDSRPWADGTYPQSRTPAIAILTMSGGLSSFRAAVCCQKSSNPGAAVNGVTPCRSQHRPPEHLHPLYRYRSGRPAAESSKTRTHGLAC